METYLLHPSSRRNRVLRILVALGVSTIILGSIGLAYGVWLPQHTIARNVWLQTSNEPISLSHLSLTDLNQVLEDSSENLPDYEIAVQAPHNEADKTWTVRSSELELSWNSLAIQEAAVQVGRTGPWWQQYWDRIQLLWSPVTIEARYSYSDERLTPWLQSIAQEVNTIGQAPQAQFGPDGITIQNGALGQELNIAETAQEIQERAGQPTDIRVSVEQTHIPLSADGRIASEQRTQKLAPTIIKLTTNTITDPTITLDAELLFPWLQLPAGYHTASMTADIKRLTEPLNREPQNAVFELNESGTELLEFAPHTTGRAVQVDSLIDELQSILNELEQATESAQTEFSILVPFATKEPEVPLQDTNDLGIKERIGIGNSTFHHSIPNRVHNVALTSEKVDATLVLPGDEFSFNKSIGEVSSRTGFKSAYVIRNGRTEVGDGGGVCQVSTTIFRAALDAGLPITQWKPHSYRVGYYEQNTDPGYDATVYAPSVDLKFKNDTDHALVVATTTNITDRSLMIELWGTSDGRVATIHDYRIWNKRGAPPAEYIDDPNLPKGTVKQIDWAAPGANTEFSYTVKNADGSERISRKFTSYFRPWKAVFLVGTGGE